MKRLLFGMIALLLILVTAGCGTVSLNQSVTGNIDESQINNTADSGQTYAAGNSPMTTFSPGTDQPSNTANQNTDIESNTPTVSGVSAEDEEDDVEVEGENIVLEGTWLAVDCSIEDLNRSGITAEFKPDGTAVIQNCSYIYWIEGDTIIIGSQEDRDTGADTGLTGYFDGDILMLTYSRSGDPDEIYTMINTANIDQNPNPVGKWECDVNGISVEFKFNEDGTFDTTPLWNDVNAYWIKGENIIVGNSQYRGADHTGYWAVICDNILYFYTDGASTHILQRVNG